MNGLLIGRASLEMHGAENDTARLHPRSLEVLEFIKTYKADHDGVAPTIREIQEGCDISSTSVTSYHLDKLEVAGRIRRPFIASRSIEVVGGRWVGPEEEL